MARNKRLSLENLEARENPATAFALGFGGIGANTLFRFDTATPTDLSVGIPVTGLDVGDTLVGIDFRPATGQLYGLAIDAAQANAQLYTIDITGAATAVGAAAPVTGLVGAVKFGVDFNPAADRLRVITDLASDGNGGSTNNFRMNPNDGTLVAIDADLDYTGLPNGAADGPEVTVAYTNNDTDAGTGTSLFGILSGGDALATNTLNAPAFNTLTSVGALGVDTGVNAGLDIYGPANTAVAILNVAGESGLYTIDTGTAAATLVGLVGDGTIDFLDVAVMPATAPSLASGKADGSVVPLIPNYFGANAGQLTAGTAVTPIAGLAANVRTATGDVNGDGVPDIIAVTGPGTPIRVTVISGVDNTTALVAPFDPFGGNFLGGGFVTAIDFDPAFGSPGADGKAEFIVTPDQGGGPRVSIFTFAGLNTAPTVRANFFGIDDLNFRGGARAATAFLNGDAIPELVLAAGFGGGPRTAIFNGTTVFGTPTRLIGDFFAFPGTDAVTLRNGVFVAGSDINGDGIDDLIFGGGPGGGPRVFILDGSKIAAGDVAGAQAAPVANFFVAGNDTDRGGIRVAYANLDADNKGDLIVGSGEGSAAKVRAYRGVNFTTTNEPTLFQDITVFGGGILPGGVYVG